MLRVFLTNILRSVIFCVIAFIISAGLNLGLCYLFKLVFHENLSSFWLYFFVSLVVSVAFMVLIRIFGKHNSAIFPDTMISRYSYYYERIKKGKKISAALVSFSLFLHFLVAAAIATVCVLKFDEICALLENAPDSPLKNSGMYYVAALISSAIVQLGYYFIYKAHYKKARCSKCRHTLCLVYGGVEDVMESTNVEYGEREDKNYYEEYEVYGERFGSYGRIQTRSRQVTDRLTFYNCKCAICGEDEIQYDDTREYGSWSEYE